MYNARFFGYAKSIFNLYSTVTTLNTIYKLSTATFDVYNYNNELLIMNMALDQSFGTYHRI